jgi:DNA-binding MarR family transcriptional regulator
VATAARGGTPAKGHQVSYLPGELFVRDTSLGYRINYLGRLFTQALYQRIASLGVVPGQFGQLLAFFEQDGLSQRELCDQVRIEQPTMANTLQRMERDGLIRCELDPADGRRTRALLTARARDLEGDLVAAAREVNAAASSGLSAADVTAFLATMAVIIDNLDAAAGPATSPPPAAALMG